MTEIQIPSTLTHTLSTLAVSKLKKKKRTNIETKSPLKYKNYKSIIMQKYKLKNKLKFSKLASVNSEKNIHNWPSNACGHSLPHSCVGRCHRIYTPLAKRFGSPQAQKSSAPPSPTLLPFMCSAEKGKTPFDGHARTSSYIHTHPHDRQHQQQVSTIVASGGVSQSTCLSSSENQLRVVICGSPPMREKKKKHTPRASSLFQSQQT